MAAGSRRRALLRSEYEQDQLALVRGRNGIVIVAILMTVFGVVFTIVRHNKSAATDAAITLRLQRNRRPFFNRLMHLVSWPGFPPQSRLLPPSIAAALFAFGFRLEGMFQLLAWGSGGISFFFKRIMRRQRPTAGTSDIRVAVARIGGTSFPSGHVLNYLGVYGFLAYLAHTWIRPTWIRRTVVGLLGSLLALVGPSRIYLGHHWLTDVSASYLLGFSWLITVTSLYRRVKNIQVARRMRLGGKRPPLW